MKFIEQIQLHAEQVFGDKAKSENWLNQPKSEFGGFTPREHAHTEAGYLVVKEALERIRHGYAF